MKITKPQISDKDAGEVVRQLQSILESKAPIGTELEAQIPDVLEHYDFCRASGVLLMSSGQFIQPDDLRAGAEALMRRVCANPNLLAVADQFMTVFRVSYQLVLTLNLTTGTGDAADNEKHAD